MAACNKANVAVYPIDVRGPVQRYARIWTGDGSGPWRTRPGRPSCGSPRECTRHLAWPAEFQSAIQPAAFSNSFVEPDQAGGSGGVAAAEVAQAEVSRAEADRRAAVVEWRSGGGARQEAARPEDRRRKYRRKHRQTGPPAALLAGRRAAQAAVAVVVVVQQLPSNPNNPYGTRMGAPTIVPPFPPFAGEDQQALYMLADGTGGFVIVNNNDLLAGMEKIGSEQNQFYIIGYAPAESAEGSCHTLNVKVDKGYKIRSRSGYCNVRSADVLAGKPSEKQLETQLDSTQPGNLVSPTFRK